MISLAIGVFAWPATARVLRAEVLRVKNSDYVMASTALGVSRFRILLAPRAAELDRPGDRHHDDLARRGHRRRGDPVLPRRRPAARASCRGATTSARRRPTCDGPQVLIYPSIALSVTVLAFIMLGEVVRDALDPKARAQR